MSFLSLVAKKLGKLKKGGLPDRVQAAKIVLRDWNVGRVSNPNMGIMIYVVLRYIIWIALWFTQNRSKRVDKPQKIGAGGPQEIIEALERTPFSFFHEFLTRKERYE